MFYLCFVFSNVFLLELRVENYDQLRHVCRMHRFPRPAERGKKHGFHGGYGQRLVQAPGCIIEANEGFAQIVFC